VSVRTVLVKGHPVQVAFGGGRENEPLLIVPGIGGSYRLPQELLFPEFREDFFCIAPSLPGFGGTPPLPGIQTMERYADFLRDLLDALGMNKACAIGISMGGTVSLAFAAKYPERIRKLVLEEAPYRGADFSPRVRKLFAIVQRLSFLPGIPEAFAWLGRSEFLASVAGRKHTGRDQTPGWIDQEDRRDTNARAWVDCVADLTRCNFMFAAQELTVPTLLLGGENSSWGAEATTERLAQLIPQSSSLLVPDTGHLLPYVEPNLFAGLATIFFKQTIL